MSALVRVVFTTLALFLSLVASAATFTVLNTLDSGPGSLRAAILAANGAPGADTIEFNIPAAGVQSIAPTSPLPLITDPVTVNGYTQPGASANTNALNAGINAVLLIELTGVNSALTINADGTVIRGIVSNLNGDSIVVNANNVTIAGNFIGTNAAGTAGLPLAGGGFGIRHNVGNNLTVGGPNAADRNLLSGSAQGGLILGFIPVSTGHLIQGNYIGPDKTGTLSLTPVTVPGGLSNVNNATVIGNLISGNGGGGLGTINVAGPMIIRGNLIGTQRDGTSPLPNGNFGGMHIEMSGALIGGAGAGEPNIIAFNNGPGVWIRALNVQGNRISQNVIHSNFNLGITLSPNLPGTPTLNDAGDPDTVAGNDGQNFPVITSAVVASGNATVSGTLNSLASTQFRIEFFANTACHSSGYGQGQTFIGSTDVTTNASGNASFGPLVFAVPAGQSVITSTATDTTLGNTSEFSQCPAVVPVPQATSTSLISSLNPSTVGQPVTFTATVTGNNPTGTVEFREGMVVLGSSALSGTSATLTISTLTQGTHPITAVYSGDANNLTSTSSILNQVVNAPAPGATTTSLSSSVNPSLLGQSVTFTATVSGNTPTGTIQFMDNGSLLATVALSGGTATFTTSALGLGTHPMTAVYSGDANNLGSTSLVLNQVVEAIVVAPTAPLQVPTLGSAAMLALSLLLALLGAGWMRRRR